MLEFQKESHRYFLDGEEIPSVSELTRFIHREVYDGDVPQTLLDEAADRGTRVHEATLELDETGTVEVNSDISGYIQAYVQFRKDHTVVWKAKEHMSYGEPEDFKFAGTFDRFGTVDGELALVDFKTTSTITSKHKVLYCAQLSLYSCMEYFSELWMKDKLWNQYILQLKKDGTYKLINVPYDGCLVDSCLNLDKALRKTKRKRKVKDNG